LTGNTITNNYNYNTGGIWLYNCSNNSITGNSITDTNGYGVRLDSSSDNSVTQNTLTNNYEGIELTGSTNNKISENTITNNIDGIWLSSSIENSINGNTLTNNIYAGIALGYDSGNNTFHHNNLINNTRQLVDWAPDLADFWDNGCEGNYWSNYNGSDLDKDGVGDTGLPWEGVDNYPLMNVYWNPCDINHDMKVDMRDIGVSAKAFGTFPGDAKWNPHADITGQEGIPDGKVDMRDISLIAKYFGERYS
jgi:parallel beta-helix repeat protein